ncbi:murein hydrolase activator EnvC family protein [Parasphingopyxis lamellibrachiae]|uniref:Septal ring factor EnvC (AmiA/AmiB activator) n=1 Tax=Parasphingopyxis lamellibrachiae TaxID=680125 RepID=A0A3D9FKP1_9SPHN|nr:peptidoglycan DD-metalloendopeptidase family protein [Parasphingopyxis lamellibrachiae]RED17686.1 septal ring factor EnvC (AmiA/AmiB activator) [Parasphingopyxis lamellibrachiae]
MIVRLLALIALFSAVLAPFALAQPGDRGSEAEALEEALRQRTIAQQRASQFERQAENAQSRAERAAADEAAAAAQVQAAEADLTAAQSRIRLIEELRAGQRARLAERQGTIIGLTAALQTMARRPPALALVHQGSISDLVHIRSLFSTTLPIVRERTASLRAEVVRGSNLRLQADRAVALLGQQQENLEARRVQLAALERGSRQQAEQLERSAMFEGDRVMALGEDARDIRTLMSELDRQAEIREDLITLPGPRLRPAQPGEASAPTQRTARNASNRRPPYRLPVMGEVVEGLGEVSEAGIRSRGLTIATQPGAQVIAPTAGRVSYAGDFRGFGQIVIIDHSGGWTTLITDLASVSVQVGQLVQQGAPIGRTGGDRPTVTVELRRGGEPVDISSLVSRG